MTHGNMRLLFCAFAIITMLSSVIGLGNTSITDDAKLHETGQFDGLNTDMQSNSDGVTTKGVSENEKVNSPLFDINVTYIPPNCPGGNCTIHLEIVTDDPTLIFFRWDINNDSVWDTPWMTEKFIDLYYQNGFNFTVCAEGWDGTSVKWVTYTGTNLNETTRDDWIQPPTNVGWKFRAKEEFVITHLGYWKNVTDYPSLSIRIWNFATQTVLASCKPLGTNNTTWHWCTLISPVSITYNTDYMLSCHKSSDIFPDWMVVQNQGFGWEKVEYFGYYYASGLPQRMPNIYVTNSLIPKCDFKWRQDFAFPDPQYTCTHCQNDTSAPTINDVRALPNPQEIFNDVNISAIISDDLMLETVSVNISSISGSTNVTMVFDEFTGRYYLSNSYHELGLHSFTIWASDSWDNWNSSDGSFWIQDTTPPIIQHAPISTNYVGKETNITAVVTDNHLLQDVRLNYTDYNLVSHNITMTAIGQNGYAAGIPAQASSGVIPYFIWAVDSSGNEERT